MFKSMVRTLGLTCLASVVCWTSSAQGAATLSLKAIAKNGAPIAATNNLTIAANDTITVELFYSGWSTPPFDSTCNGGANNGQTCTSAANCPGGTCVTGTGLAQTYQATLLGAASAISNGADPNNNSRLVLPVGWNAPVVRDSCPCENAAFPTCDPFYGCVGAGHTPANMASINLNCANGSCTGGCCVSNFRSDYIFYGFDNIPAVDTSSLNIRWGSTINGSDGQGSSRCTGGGNAGGLCTQAAHCPGGTCNANFLSYAGTLNLKVGSNPCGTYTFTVGNELLLTFLGSASALPVFILPTIEPLVLTTTGGIQCPSGACCNTTDPNAPTCSILPAGQCTGPDKRYGGDGSTCANINPPCAVVTGACCDTTNPSSPVCTVGSSSACTGPNKRYGGNGSTCANINPPCAAPGFTSVNPAHCTVDARRPFNPATPAVREGFKTIVFTFPSAPGAGEDAPNDFQVTQDPAAPAPPNPPAISTVAPGPGANQVTVTLAAAGQNNRWTCLRHIASNKRTCWGQLPGDANANLAVVPADILTIIDNLNGIINPALPVNQCDIDRSNVCAPADIITEIDLLNGASGFPVQNGDTLPPCPSSTP